MNFANGQWTYYHTTIIVMKQKQPHQVQIENREGEDREKIVWGDKAHSTFVKGYFSGAYVGWTVKHFFYCPQRKKYGIMLTKK